MDKPNDLQRLPVEVLDQVLEQLHADGELVSLSQVCRDMNERVTPLIYSHTIIYLSPHLNLIKEDDIEEDLADEGVQMGFGLMRGLANNLRQQCRYVRKLSVRNGYVKESTHGTRWAVASKGSYFDTTNLSSHSPWVWANIVLGMAIPLMPLLSELVWTAEMPPTKEIFSCLLPGQLKSLVYRFSDDFFYHLKIKWPPRFTPGVRGLKTPYLSSLAMTDITSWEATKDVTSLVVNNRESLKVLKLRFLEEFTRNDKLLDIVSPIIELQSQLRLHTLHLRNVLSPGVPGWLEGFDFTCIRVFVLIEANTLGNTRSKELWNIFRHTDQRFETLITNCENDAFIEFVESTQELERLVLSSVTRPIADFPKLNNHFATLKSLFLPQDAPWKFPSLSVREVMDLVSNCKQLEQLCITLDYKDQEHIFSILSELENLKHLFFDRYDDLMSAVDAHGPTLGPTAFIKTFCDFCNNNSTGLAFLHRLELVSYFRTLWSINSIGQIHTEESNQLGEIDESAQSANGSGLPKTETPESKIRERYDCIPVQIGWTDHLDDEMVLAIHTSGIFKVKCMTIYVEKYSIISAFLCKYWGDCSPQNPILGEKGYAVRPVMRLVVEAVPGFSGHGRDFPVPVWHHFQCNMKAIDYLAALDMFGDAIFGLVLLFPDNFNWSLRGEIGDDPNEKIKIMVAQAVKSLPKLVIIAQALALQAKKLAVDIYMSMLSTGASSSCLSEDLAPRLGEGIVAYPQHPPATAKEAAEVSLSTNKPSHFGPPFPTADINLSMFPTETNPASSSGLSKGLPPRSGEGNVAYPQHPPPTGRGVFQYGLGANKPIPFGPPFPTVDNTPSQSKSTAMDIDSLLI